MNKDNIDYVLNILKTQQNIVEMIEEKIEKCMKMEEW